MLTICAMTTQGQRNPLPAGHHPDAAAQRRPVGGRRRRAVLWCALAGVAVGGAWVITRPTPGDLLPGLGPTSTKPAAAAPAPGVAGTQPLTEAQSFTAERYFPTVRAIDQDGYRARRSAARQGGDCADTQVDRAHDALKDLGCQGYVAVAFTGADQPIVSSVTVLRFADAAAAQKAEQAVRERASTFAFVMPDGVPAPSASPAARPMEAVRTVLTGHYLAVAVSRYTDHRTGSAPDQHLTDANHAAVATARAPFLWM